MDGNLTDYIEMISNTENQLIKQGEVNEIKGEINILKGLYKVEGRKENFNESEIKIHSKEVLKIEVNFKPLNEFDYIQLDINTDLNEGEIKLIEEIKFMLEDDGKIDDKERLLLERIRNRFNISKERSEELEAFILSQKSSYTKEEEEYIETIKHLTEKNNVITHRDREILDRLAKILNIDKERALKIEKDFLSQI